MRRTDYWTAVDCYRSFFRATAQKHLRAYGHSSSPRKPPRATPDTTVGGRAPYALRSRSAGRQVGHQARAGRKKKTRSVFSTRHDTSTREPDARESQASSGCPACDAPVASSQAIQTDRLSRAHGRRTASYKHARFVRKIVLDSRGSDRRIDTRIVLEGAEQQPPAIRSDRLPRARLRVVGKRTPDPRCRRRPREQSSWCRCRRSGKAKGSPSRSNVRSLARSVSLHGRRRRSTVHYAERAHDPSHESLASSSAPRSGEAPSG